MDHVWGIPLTLLYFGIFILIVFKWKHFQDESISKKLVSLFFIYKVFLGLALSLLYTYYYPNRNEADIFKYFDDSYHMTRALWEKPSDFFQMLFGIGNDTDYFTGEYYSKMNNWFRQYETQVYNDNHTIIRFNAVVRLFSFGYFHIHSLFMSFISFWGIMSFYKGFALFTNKNKHFLLACCLFLFPSLNFWSAGPLKEGLLIFALGNIFYMVCLLVHKRFQPTYIVLGIISIWLMMFLKSYALAAMAAGLTGLVIGYFFKNKMVGLAYLSLAVLGVLAIGLFSSLYPDYNIPAIISQKQQDFYRLSLYMNAGSTYNIGAFGPTWGELLRIAPKAFVTGLFRPTILDVNSPLMLLSALEGLLFIAAPILSVVFFRKPEKHQVNMLLCCLVTIVVLCTVIGLATANFGGLVRYKIPAIPFIIFACLCLIDAKWNPVWKRH